MIDDRRQIVGGPLLRPCRGDDAGHLAHDVLGSGQAIHVTLPLRPILGLNVHVAAVIEDETGVRARFGELAGVGELAGAHAQVEAKAHVAEHADAAHEIRRQAIAGRRRVPVQHLVHAFEIEVRLKLSRYLRKSSLAGRAEMIAAFIGVLSCRHISRTYSASARCWLTSTSTSM